MSKICTLTSWNTIRMAVVVGFLLLYGVVTLHMVGMQQQNCLSLEDIADQIRKMTKQEQEQEQLRLRNSTAAVHVDAESTVRVTGPLGQTIGAASQQQPSELNRERTKNAPLFFVQDKMSVDKLLSEKYAPNTVYFVWCGRRWFEFAHYLSVISVTRHLRPDNMIFFYDVEPVVDSWTYNTWYTELFEKFPFFRSQLLGSDEKGCLSYAQANPQFIYSLLAYRGGMYVNESTILNKFPVEYRLDDIVLGLHSDNSMALLMSKQGFPAKTGIEQQLTDSRTKSRRFSCVSREQFTGIESNAQKCLTIDRAFFPKDIWELDDSFGRLVRTLFYGRPEILRALPSYDELIPNIAHIVWLGGGEMDFLFYLGVLSLVYVAKVDMVYIHGDGPPRGRYWDLVKGNEKVQLIYRENPGKVYGTAVNVISHVTDVWRVDFMIKYGGIYVDTDVVFVKPMDREIRGYDAVGTYDWTYWNHPFPDTINFGVAIGKRNAPYWHKFQESMKWFMDNDWSWNGLRQPYRILERQPDLVRIDPRLQVTCFQSRCHPTWWPDYHNESIHHLNSDSIKDWRNDVYSFHWTLPTPYELLNHTNLLKTNTMFSEIGKYVLQQAGLFDFFAKTVEQESGIKIS